MSGFTSQERLEVDVHVKTLAGALHDVRPAFAEAYRRILHSAEQAAADPTLARVMVAREILRGINAEARPPRHVGTSPLPAALVRALSEAEALGQTIGPSAISSGQRLVSLLFRRKTLSRQGRQALMRCRAIAAACEMRAGHRASRRDLRKAG